MLGRMIIALRQADWLDPSRARGYRLVLALVLFGGAIGWILLSRHGIDRAGKPLGTDFLAFWSAARLALAGTPDAAWNIVHIAAAERAAMPVDPGPSSFLYPPPFLLVCLPFGLLPYFIALPLWLALTGAAYFAAVRFWLPGHRGAILTIAAFPAVMSNLGHGQNGFLTAALLGSGLWLLDRRPFVAGLLLGALVIKPQIALAVPILLLTGGYGRTMLAALGSAATLCAAATFCFGWGVWSAFLDGAGLGRAILDHGLVEPEKMVSSFAALRVLHASPALAYAGQILVATIAVPALVRVGRAQRISPGGAAAFTVAVTLLITPFLLDYDLTAAAIPLAWLFSDGLRRGFRPWEKSALLAGYILPLIARPLALATGLPIAPLILAALAIIIARAALSGQEATQPSARPEAAAFG